MSSKSTDKETKSVAEAADVKEAETVKADAKSEADTAVKGETKTVTLGYYVPVKDIEELCSRCIISISGSYDAGYTFGLGISKEQ